MMVIYRTPVNGSHWYVNAGFPGAITAHLRGLNSLFVGKFGIGTNQRYCEGLNHSPREVGALFLH